MTETTGCGLAAPVDSSPGQDSLDGETRARHLEQQLLLFQCRLSKQERLADNQHCLFKTVRREYEIALAQLTEKNSKLELLSRELLAVKSSLEREVRKRTKNLEKKNASLEEYARQVAQTNIALDVLLQKHERERRTTTIKSDKKWRTEILQSLERLKQISPLEKQQALIGLIAGKVGAVVNAAVSLHPLASLSERETTVAGLVAEGMSSSEVAQHLHISVRCVHSHCYSIRKKLGLARKVRLKNHLAQVMS